MMDDRIHLPRRPACKPRNAQFMSGPCPKRPGYDLTTLDTSLLGRSRRAEETTARRREVIDLSRQILGVPDTWHLGIIPGSDMGAMEAALWGLLGQRPVDVIDFDGFGHFWAVDVIEQLQVAGSRVLKAPPGEVPDLKITNWRHDVVLVANGTSAGTRIPDDDWIPANREGLVICDASSAAFAMHLPWHKLDAVTWSWQKALGGEGAHGMLALSPRAVERLKMHQPAWPIPKLLRLAEGGKFREGVFRGESINTPSQLCVEDALDALRWAKKIGGLPALLERTEANYATLARWVAQTPWITFLAKEERIRSHASVCLSVAAPWYERLSPDDRAASIQRMTALLAAEGVAFDIQANPMAPPGLRIWCGPTVERDDIQALLPWLDWAYDIVSVEYELRSLASA
jgi:phosphoserine aminotransferase